jgi:hypothetical protein
MTTKASTLGPGSLKIGATGSEREWAGQSTKTTLTPNVDSEDSIPTLDGGELEGEETTTWELSGTILQDYDLDSLEDFAFDNAGKWLACEFVPNNAKARAYSLEVKLRPLAVGGDVKKRNTSDFTFPARKVEQIENGAA